MFQREDVFYVSVLCVLLKENAKLRQSFSNDFQFSQIKEIPLGNLNLAETIKYSKVGQIQVTNRPHVFNSALMNNLARFCIASNRSVLSKAELIVRP